MKHSLNNILLSFLVGLLVLTVSFFTIKIAFVDIMAGYVTFLLCRHWLSKK